MIYNLVKYLLVSFPAYAFVCNGLQKGSPANVIEVDEAGGDPSYYLDRKDYSVKILSRATSKTVARIQAEDIYNILQKKFGLILPEETVEGITYPEVKTWRIIANHSPMALGSDENGKNLFSLNFTITT